MESWAFGARHACVRLLLAGLGSLALGNHSPPPLQSGCSHCLSTISMERIAPGGPRNPQPADQPL